jgi:flagellar motor switch protein FliM
VEGVKKFYSLPGRVKGSKGFQVVREEEPRYA